MSVSPIVTVQEADERDRAPGATSIREIDTLTRIANGETLVLAGFTRERETRERQRDRWFGRSTVVIRRRVELVILVTPKILSPVGID